MRKSVFKRVGAFALIAVMSLSTVGCGDDNGDSDLLEYDERPITERFNKNFRYISAVKSMTKGGIKNATIGIHKPLRIQNYCNSNGEIIIPGRLNTHKITVENAEIRHYITKTIGEFYKRLIRGWPAMNHGEGYKKFVDHRINYFFSLNKITRIKFDKIYPLITDKLLL